MDFLRIIHKPAVISCMLISWSCLFFSQSAWAQFAPQAGQDGSTAIHRDSSIFIDWANDCVVDRGWKNIALPDSGLTNYGTATDAIGKANNLVVSLGDGGQATVFFEEPLADGPGYDFAVFENGFLSANTDYAFLELAFVEVSSNGLDFVRFEGISLTMEDEQIESFGVLDASKIHNLAGKYINPNGVPFDLADLTGSEDVDIQNIIAIRVVDVVGSVDENYATSDAEGNRINDPWPTTFPTGGFDLDAVGVIHNQSNIGSVAKVSVEPLKAYPNPFTSHLSIAATTDIKEILIMDAHGRVILRQDSEMGQINFSTVDWPAGLYLIKANSKDQSYHYRIVKY